MKILLSIFLIAALSGCAQFQGYCDSHEVRKELRELNPYNIINVAVGGACAANKVIYKPEV